MPRTEGVLMLQMSEEVVPDVQSGDGGYKSVGSASKLEGGLSGAKKFLAVPVGRADHPMGPRSSK